MCARFFDGKSVREEKNLIHLTPKPTVFLMCDAVSYADIRILLRPDSFSTPLSKSKTEI
jgi:hypothetical protein